MKKALILLGGITQKAYIYQEVWESDFDTASYDEVIQIDYEPFLDKRWGWLPFYGKFRLLDKFTDWRQFVSSRKIREAIRGHVKERIESLQADGYAVDCLAHSLGTWVLMGTDIEVDAVWLFGSPLGSKYGIVSDDVKQELYDRFMGGGMQCKRIVYAYNRSDVFSANPPERWILSHMIKNGGELKICHAGCGHNLVQYVNALVQYENAADAGAGE